MRAARHRSEPFPSDAVALGRHRVLLELRREDEGADVLSDLLEDFERLAFGEQRFALSALVDPAEIDLEGLVFLGDGLEVEMLEISLVDEVAREIVLVQPLLDGDDAARTLVVEAREQGLLIEFLDALSLNIGLSIRYLHQIVDDQDVGAEARHRATQRDGLADPLHGRHGLGRGVTLPVHLHGGKEVLVQRGLDQGTEIASVICCEVLAVARDHHLERGVTPEHPGDEGHRCADGF